MTVAGSQITLSKLIADLAREDPRSASIVTLKALGDLSADAIARSLSIPRKEVTDQLDKAKARLRSCVSGVGLREDDVPGLHIYRSAIPPSQQQSLKTWIASKADWQPDRSRLRWWHIYEYVYAKDMLRPTGFEVLPPMLLEFARLAHEHRWMTSLAEQATIQKYLVGSYISPHVDSRRCFPGEIVTASLVSPARLRLTDIWTPRKFQTILQPGDVTVLRGDAREFWKHEILECTAPAGWDKSSWYRYSITLRTINRDRILGKDASK